MARAGAGLSSTLTSGEDDVNWEAIGALGEIVGAGAVVVTLIYLAGQVRQATRATRAASFQAASALEQEFLLSVGQDPGTARTWAAFMFGDPTTLSDDERAQGFFLMASILRRLENFHQQHLLGTISLEAWQARQGMYRAIARSRAYADFAKGPAFEFLGQDFVAFMEQLSAAASVQEQRSDSFVPSQPSVP